MAPTFRSGKGARVIFNNSDLSAILNDATLTGTAAALDVTAFQQNDKAFIPGIKDATVAYKGLWDGSTVSTGRLDRRFQDALAASTQPYVLYGPEGDAVGRRCYIFRHETVGYVANSPVAGVVNVTANGQISGARHSGNSRNPSGAEASFAHG